MIYNEISNFPNSVDNLIFFSDISIENKGIMDRYNTLIREGRFTDATNYLNSSDINHAPVASLFNLIENRIYNTQNYLSTKQNKAPTIYHQQNVPTGVSSGVIWIQTS